MAWVAPETSDVPHVRSAGRRQPVAVNGLLENRRLARSLLVGAFMTGLLLWLLATVPVVNAQVSLDSPPAQGSNEVASVLVTLHSERVTDERTNGVESSTRFATQRSTTTTEPNTTANTPTNGTSAAQERHHHGVDTGGDAGEPGREAVLAGLGVGSEDSGPAFDPLEPVARALLYAALSVVVGVPLVFVLVVQPVLGVSVHRTRRLWFVLTGGSILLVGSVVLLALVHTRYGGYEVSVAGFGAFVGTRLGRLALFQTVLAVTLLSATVLAAVRRVQSPKAVLGVAGGGALLSLFVSLSSHSASVVDGPTGIVVDFGHLLGAGLWVGGLAALVVLATPELGRLGPTAARTATSRLVRRFSLLALTAVGLAGATGLWLAAWHVRTPNALLTTDYGAVLSAKVVFVVVAVGLGGLNRFVIGRSLAQRSRGARAAITDGGSGASWLPERDRLVRWFVWSTRVELGVLLVAVALSGGLTSLPTAATAAESGIETSLEPTVLVDESGDVEVRTSVVPSRVGTNVLDVEFRRDGVPTTAERAVFVSFTHPETNIELQDEQAVVSGENRYSTVVVFPTYGRWTIQVSTWVDGRFVTAVLSLPVPDPSEDAATTDNTTTTVSDTNVPESSSREDDVGGAVVSAVRIGGILVGALAAVGIGRDFVAFRRDSNAEGRRRG